MASTGTINGRRIAIYTGTPKVKITCQTNSTLSVNIETRDTSCKDSSGNWSEAIPGVQSWTLSGEGKLAYDSANGFSELFAMKGTTVTVAFASDVSGDNMYSGSAILTELSAETPDNEDSTFSFSFQGTGALTESTVS